jgi:methylase of polypeptide subunit release factors
MKIRVNPKESLTKTNRLEFGDFQTPLALAEKVCHKLQELGIEPDVIIEPTCGIGTFVKTSAKCFPSSTIIGLDINQTYLNELERQLPNHQQVTALQADFFNYDWTKLLSKQQGTVLVLGNFPWVTNSRQGALSGSNLPDKSNFQNHTGLDTLTGKSNFDISEWMLIEAASWLKEHGGYIAMLCKTSVARKFLNHLRSNDIGVAYSFTYGINAKQYFGAAVETCLLVCELVPFASSYDCRVFETLDAKTFYEVGQRKGMIVRDIQTFGKLEHLLGKNERR